MLKYLNKKLILRIEENLGKKEIIDRLIETVYTQSGLIDDKEAFSEKIYAREEMGTTGIGRGIVVPHARCEKLKDIVFAVAQCKNGIEDYNTPDGEMAKVVLLAGAPKDKNGEYLKLLSNISRAFRQEEYRNNIILSRDLDELIEGIASIEE